MCVVAVKDGSVGVGECALSNALLSNKTPN